jgi:ribosomal protein L28
MKNINTIADLNEAVLNILKQIHGASYRAEVIKVNISSTFLAKARCKFCGKGPTTYYQRSKPFYEKDVRAYLNRSKDSRRKLKRMNSDWYLSGNPKSFAVSTYKTRIDDKHYRPNLARTRGASDTDNEVVEILICDCGVTVWAFNNSSNKNHPEIKNHKGKYSYPNKFTYY